MDFAFFVHKRLSQRMKLQPPSNLQASSMPLQCFSKQKGKQGKHNQVSR